MYSLLSGYAAQVWCRYPPYHHILFGPSALDDCIEVACPVIKCGKAHGGVIFTARDRCEAGFDCAFVITGNSLNHVDT